mmetsp:Transcript_8270/g.15589  ORF Transcript_8270/g.15589 Transcript_8270/m.15589 type:complete len:765 (-) Transcript_8270:230-2524(-)
MPIYSHTKVKPGSVYNDESSADKVSQDIDIVYQHQLSWNYIAQVLKSDYSEEFAKFKLKKSSHYVPLCLCIMQSLFGLWRAQFVSEPGVPPLYKLANYVKLIVPFLGWVYIYAYSQYDASNDSIGYCGKRIILLGNSCIILQALLTGLLSIVWVITHEQCSAEPCLEGFPSQIIPLGLLFHQICGGVAMPLFYSCHDVFASILSVFITYSTMIITALLLHMKTTDVIYIFLTAVVISMAFVTYESSLFSNFTSFSRFEIALREQLVSENKESVMKLQTEEMRHMIGNVAHDLRTPLQAFQSELDLLRKNAEEHASEGGDDDNVQLTSVIQLSRIANFMNMIINRSIDFAKASSGLSLAHTIECVNIESTFHWAVGCVAASQEKIAITVQPLPLSIHKLIFTDKQWLLESLLCLLSNAQKYTSVGEITLCCSLDRRPIKHSSSNATVDMEVEGAGSTWSERTQEKGSSTFLLIEVEDTGIGVSEENRRLLFKPLVQANRRTGGTGLGLYALSKRMESLGGSCGVKSRADGATGSCFWISIPYKPNESSVGSSVPTTVCDNSVSISLRSNSYRRIKSINAKSSHAHANPTMSTIMSGFISQSSMPVEEDDTQHHRKYMALKILLVDDSNLIRKGMARSLINDGHTVELAQHGADALNILEASLSSSENGPSYDFDLILMDLQMPVMDGLEATRRIRAMEALRVDEEQGGSHIMIIGISANAEGEVRHDCLESGMDGFMEKPVKIDRIHEYYKLFCSRSIRKGSSSL